MQNTMSLPTHSQPVNPALLLDNQLCFALYSASHAMTRLYTPLLDGLGLTYPQYLVMLVLWELDGQTVSAVGARLSLDSGTLTPLLKRMEAAGLIERRRSSEDERRVQVFVSAKGVALKDQAAAVPECIVVQTGCELPELMRLTYKIQALRDHVVAPPALFSPPAPLEPNPKEVL
jgi:DNA-binding MarR family transcriptional regulator